MKCADNYVTLVDYVAPPALRYRCVSVVRDQPIRLRYADHPEWLVVEYGYVGGTAPVLIPARIDARPTIAKAGDGSARKRASSSIVLRLSVSPALPPPPRRTSFSLMFLRHSSVEILGKTQRLLSTFPLERI